MRLERLEERGEAKVRQELALEGVAHGGEPVPVAQPHEGREVHLAGNAPGARCAGNGITADDVLMVADQRTLVILVRVEVSGQLTVVDRQNKPAVEGCGQAGQSSPPWPSSPRLDTLREGKGRR